jgi:hypothetical protein
VTSIPNLKAKYNDFWGDFAGSPSVGLYRIAFAILSLTFLDITHPAILNFSYPSPALWQPPAFERFLNWPVSPDAFHFAIRAYSISFIFILFGFLTRPALLVAFLASTYLTAEINNQGSWSYSNGLYCVSLLILFFTKSSNYYSVISSFKKPKFPIARSIPNHWALRLIQIIFVWSFFGAAIVKLQVIGWKWALSNNLVSAMVARNISDQYLATSWEWPIVKFLVQNPQFTMVLAFGSLLLELFSPLAFVHRNLKWLILASLALMQISIYVTLHESFVSYAPVYLVWLPWDKWDEKIRQHYSRI